jgi:hypothetical protein
VSTVGLISVWFRNYWTSYHLTGVHSKRSSTAFFHPTLTRNTDFFAHRKVRTRLSTRDDVANPRSMDKGEKMTDAMISDEANNVIDEAVKHAITQSSMTIVYEVVQGMLKTDPTVSALKEVIKHDLIKVINTRVQVLINERVNKSDEGTITKAALQAKLEMVSFVLHHVVTSRLTFVQAKDVSATRATLIKSLEDHLELRARRFEDFSALLESTCVDAGEDGLGAGGLHTTNLNIAHIINDRDDEVLKQTIEHLQTGLPGEAEISEIEADLAKMVTKEEAIKKEGAANGAH